MANKRSRSGDGDGDGDGDSVSHLAQSSSSSSSSKVCIVCSCARGEYAIFIVDLDLMKNTNNTRSDRLPPRDPTVRIDSGVFHNAAFCVLGSTLYAFEGYDLSKAWYLITDELPSKSVFTFELPPNSSNLRLDKNMLQEAPSMLHQKFHPKATPTPDGKNILVFSTDIRFSSLGPEFELYDPVNKSWTPLPAIHRSDVKCLSSFFHDLPFMRVQSFTFIDSSVFLLQTDVGLFSLDYLHGRSWKWLDPFDGGFSRFPQKCDRFVLIGKDICLTPHCAYDINPVRDRRGGGPEMFSRRSFDYPNLTIPCKGYSQPTSRITPLVDECHFCILHTAKNKTGLAAALVLQEYSLDLDKCVERLSSSRKRYKKRRRRGRLLPGVSEGKTFGFTYRVEEPFLVFNPTSFSYIPPPLDTV